MTGQEASANPFEFWKDMAQKWSEGIGQSNFGGGPFAAGSQFTTPPMFNPFQQFQNANPFQANNQAYNPAQVWMQLCQQSMKIWSEFGAQAGAGGPTEETFRAAEKQWMQQLEQAAEALSQSMATEACSSMIGKFIEQGLAWQEKFAAQVNPQIDAAHRALNLPSRDQMDRMFERVIGIEERLDDLDDARQALKRLEQRLDEIEQLGREVLNKVSVTRSNPRRRTRTGPAEAEAEPQVS